MAERTRFGRSCDAEARLRLFFEKRESVSDKHILFSPMDDACVFFSGDDPPVFNGPPWTPPTGVQLTPWVKAVVYRMARINQLIVSCHCMWGAEVLYWLHIHMDTHVRWAVNMMKGGAPPFTDDDPVQEDTLPNMATDVLRACMSVDSGHVSRSSSADDTTLVISIFGKIMPDNGQPRELNKFIIKAIHNKEVRTMLHTITLCSLLGNYRHCVFRLPLLVRLHVMKDFTEEKFVELLQESSAGSLMMFYVLREYFFVIGKFMPSYNNLMHSMFVWDKQCTKVCEMMRDIRTMAAMERPWSSVFFSDRVNEAFKKHYRRMPKKKLKRRETCAESCLKIIIEKAIRKRGMRPSMGRMFNHSMASEFFKHAGDSSLMNILVAAGRGTEVESLSHALEHKAITIESFSSVPDESMKLMHDAAGVADTFRAVFVVQLPQKILKSMVEAVARRFGCSESDWPTLQRVTKVYICPCCRKIKNFFLGPNEIVDPKNTGASGYMKIVLPAFVGGDGAYRCAVLPACRGYTLLAYDLLAQDSAEDMLRGGVLHTHDACITISTCCGRLCSVGSIVFTGGKRLCPVCIQDGMKKLAMQVMFCVHCNKELKTRRNDNVHQEVVHKKDGTTHVLTFCKKHYKPWLVSTYANDVGESAG